MSNKAPERIAIPDLQTKMKSNRNLMIVDVRTAKEIQESGAVPGAVHVPVDQIDQHIDEFPKADEIVCLLRRRWSGFPRRSGPLERWPSECLLLRTPGLETSELADC